MYTTIFVLKSEDKKKKVRCHGGLDPATFSGNPNENKKTPGQARCAKTMFLYD